MWLHEFITEESRDQIRVCDPSHDFTFEMWGMAPVQALGEVAGRDFYFRARHNEWSCEVSDSDGRLSSDGCSGPDTFYREGRHENASYMKLREALKIIDKCMSEYFSRSITTN